MQRARERKGWSCRSKTDAGNGEGGVRQDETTAWEGTRRRVERSFWPAYGICEPRSSRYFTRVSEVAKQTPPRSLSLLPSPPYFALLSNLLSSFQAPLHPRSLPHSRCHRCYCCCCCCTLGYCTLFTPLSWGRGLYFRLTVKVNGATSRGELPRRLTGTPNHNFNAYACARILYVCVSELQSSLHLWRREISKCDICYHVLRILRYIFHIF